MEKKYKLEVTEKELEERVQRVKEGKVYSTAEMRDKLFNKKE